MGLFGKKKDNTPVEEIETKEEVEAVDATDSEVVYDLDTEDINTDLADPIKEEVSYDLAEDDDENNKQEEKPELEVKVQPKEKKLGLVKTFNMYKFVVKIIATVLLLTLGILVLVFNAQAVFAIYIITGGVAVFQALIRATFLLRRDRNPKAKIASLIELLVELALGGLFLFFAYSKFHWIEYHDNTSKEGYNQFLINTSVFANANYSLFAALLFFTAIISFMFRTIMFKERCDSFKFGIYLTQLIAGIFLMMFYAMPKSYNGTVNADGALVIENVVVITPWVLAIVIGVLSLVSAIVIGGEAAVGFWKYYTATHPEIAERKAAKKKAKEEAKAQKKAAHSDIDMNAVKKDDTSNSDFVN